MSTTTNTFKVQGAGLDLTGLEYVPSFGESFNGEGIYFHTSPASNNDYIISSITKKFLDAPVIVTLDFLEGMEPLLRSHLDTIGRDHADLILIPSKVTIESGTEAVRDVIGASKCGVGIKNPESPEELERIKDEMGVDFKYVSLDLCPLNFNYSIIKWCQEKEVSIIGFNPFGGRLSGPSVIEALSIPYLLGFASTYSSLVFLSCRDLFTAIEGIKYVGGLIGKPSSPRYIIKKTVKKLYKPVKKVVGTSIKVDDTTYLPYNCPGAIFSFQETDLTLGSPTLKIGEPVSGLEEEAREVIDQIRIPEGLKDNEILSIIRPILGEWVKAKYLEETSTLEFCRLGESGVILRVSYQEEKEVISKGSWFKKGRIKAETIIKEDIFTLVVFQGKPIVVFTADQNP